MKKILFIIWSYSLGGGAEALLTTIVNHLNPQKYQIGIMELYHSEIKKEPVNPNIKVYAPIMFEGDLEYQKKMHYIYREPDRIIGKYIPQGYDLYVSFNYQTPSFLLPDGCRNIAWVHTSVYDLAEDCARDYWQMQRKAFEKAMQIVSISDITTESLQTLFPEQADKIVEIYNAVNIEEVRKKAENYTEIVLEHPAIIYVGRLDENKDPLRMLDIFTEIVRKNSFVHLYYLGSGELEIQLREKVREYCLENKVYLLGYLENPFPVVRQADICCVTSKSEGFPMRLLESTALHIPFVSTEVGGARILANGGRCGRVYTTNREAVEAIMDIMDTPKNFLKEECEKSISRFDLSVYISKIEQLFDAVLQKPVVYDGDTVWDYAKDSGLLEDKPYYYHFPDSLIPKGKRVVIYGAGIVGTDYYRYMKETNDYQMMAWVDAAAWKYRTCGKEVWDIDTILNLEYDVILIAVMQEAVAQSICRGLRMKGIPDDKILWTRPIF